MCLADLLNMFKPKAPKPAEYALGGDDYAKYFMHAKEHLYMWDSTYYLLSFEDWQKVIADVLAGMPKYLAEKFDCEDFAFLCMSRVLEKYQLNSMGIAVGNTVLGYHGFNVFLAQHPEGPKAHILEPQTGTIDPQGYDLDTVIFG